MKTYRPSEEVDFVIVGSGAAGGVMARELSRAGYSVVVLEAGPWLTEKDFHHDVLWGEVHRDRRLTNDPKLLPQTIRSKDSDTAKPNNWGEYGRCVGGGSLHFSANYWRFPEVEFHHATRYGVPAGSNVADWPITYADLESYYTKVEWEIGVSGLAGNPFEAPRTKGYPVPPLPIKSEGVLLERAAKKLGYTAWPAPMAILSRPYRGRSACVACGFCYGFACEMRAKSSSAVTMIPEAVATNRCEIRTLSYARKVETNAAGKVTGVVYFGQVGRNIMFNGAGGAQALFEHEVNAWKGVVASRVIWDTFELPETLGLYGGGGFDFRNPSTPMSGGGFWDGGPLFGSAWKRQARDLFTKSLSVYGHTSTLPVGANRVDLDPDLKDAWGLPAPRLTFAEHPEDVKLANWFGRRGKELLEAAGAVKVSDSFGDAGAGGPHLLGTCRMGKDPRTSVVGANHRAHDVPNLYIVDGSNFVTSGRGQPTMTIQALAFRAAALLTRT